MLKSINKILNHQQNFKVRLEKNLKFCIQGPLKPFHARSRDLQSMDRWSEWGFVVSYFLTGYNRFKLSWYTTALDFVETVAPYMLYKSPSHRTISKPGVLKNLSIITKPLSSQVSTDARWTEQQHDEHDRFQPMQGGWNNSMMSTMASIVCGMLYSY